MLDEAQQLRHLGGLGAAVQGGDEFDGPLQPFEVGGELGLQLGVELADGIALNGGGYAPPDGAGAVGPDRVVQLINGVACVDNAQCQSTWCARGDNMTCGACGPKPTAGTSCANQECGEGLSCVKDVCVTPGMAGAGCDADHPCRAGYACKGVTPGSMGTCALGIAAGGACEAFLGPNNAGCDQTKGLYCHPTMRVCTAVSYAKTGEACGVV